MAEANYPGGLLPCIFLLLFVKFFCKTMLPRQNSKFLADSRYPLLNRFQGARHFLRDQTFLLCILCLQHNPALRDGPTPVRASSGQVSTSSSAFLSAFSGQRSCIW